MNTVPNMHSQWGEDGEAVLRNFLQTQTQTQQVNHEDDNDPVLKPKEGEFLFPSGNLTAAELEESFKQLKENKETTSKQPDNNDEPYKDLSKIEADLKAKKEPVTTTTTALKTDDIYPVAYELIRELGYNFIPDEELDNLTEEKFNYYKQQDEIARQTAAVENLLSTINDPVTRNVLVAAFNNAPINDLLEIKNVVNYEQKYSSFDLEDETSRRNILIDFLKEGLDPTNPAHKYRLDKVEEDVDGLIATYQDKAKAEEAKAYFVEKYRKQNEAKQHELAEAQKLEARRREEEKINVKKWHDTLNNEINALKVTKDKKEKLAEEYYSTVEIEGKQLPLWYYKNNIILNDPKLFKHYLNFLATFDIDTNNFGKSLESDDMTQVQQHAQNKVLELARKKAEANRRTNTQEKPNTATTKNQKWR